MRAQAAVLVLILAACSGPAAVPRNGAGLRRQPEHGGLDRVDCVRAGARSDRTSLR